MKNVEGGANRSFINVLGRFGKIQSGFGVTRVGQGVLLPEAVRVPLEVPKKDGEYMLWLFHVEGPDEDKVRPVFDTTEMKPSRMVETVAPRLHPLDDDQPDAIALCRINVRLGRMVQVLLPVPRAGRQGVPSAPATHRATGRWVPYPPAPQKVGLRRQWTSRP